MEIAPIRTSGSFLRAVGGLASSSQVSIASASPVARDPVKLAARAEDVVDDRYDRLSWLEVRRRASEGRWLTELAAALRLQHARAAN